MTIFNISIIVIVLGLVGYVWKLRNTITKLIPGQKDDEVLDTIEGLAKQVGLNVNNLAANSRGKLKKRIKEEL